MNKGKKGGGCTCDSVFLSDLLPCLWWVVEESFQQRDHLCPLSLFRDLQSGVHVAKPLALLVLDISKVPATCNQPLDDFMLPFRRGVPQRCALILVVESDINSRISQKNIEDRHLAAEAPVRERGRVELVFQIHINVLVGEEHLDNLNVPEI